MLSVICAVEEVTATSTIFTSVLLSFISVVVVFDGFGTFVVSNPVYSLNLIFSNSLVSISSIFNV